MVLTNREQVLKKMKLPNDASPSIEELSKFFKVPVSILKEVMRRARNAYSNDPLSVRLKTGEKGVKAPMSQKMSVRQWEYGRVYSFLNKATTYRTTDSDLAKKAGF